MYWLLDRTLTPYWGSILVSINENWVRELWLPLGRKGLNIFCLTVTYVFSVRIVYIQRHLNVVLWSNIFSNNTHVIYYKTMTSVFSFQPVAYILYGAMNVKPTKIDPLLPLQYIWLNRLIHASYTSLHRKMCLILVMIMCSNLAIPLV